MEKYFQARFTVNRSGDRMGFNNFANGYYQDFPDTGVALCSGGYITIVSPQGTKVCTGSMKYADPRSGAVVMIAKGISYFAENCRWK